MRKRKGISLRIKTGLAILLTGVLLSAALIFTVDTIEHTDESVRNADMSRHVVAVAASALDTQALRTLMQSGRGSAAYEGLMDDLRRLYAASGAQSLFVFAADREGMRYLLDVDAGEEFVPLQLHRAWGPTLNPYVSQMLAGQAAPPTLWEEASGAVYLVMMPLGEIGGEQVYLAAEFEAGGMISDSASIASRMLPWAVGLTLLALLTSLLLQEWWVLRPVRRMTRAARRPFEEKETADGFSALPPAHHDEVGALQEALQRLESANSEQLLRLDTARRKAETDALTGASNRGAFEWRVTAALPASPDSGQMHAYMMIKIDEFKRINDRYGLPKGDEVLRALANLLRGTFRTSDAVGRIGGDEFGVFCTDVPDIAFVRARAAQLLEKWRGLGFQSETGVFHATLSIGIALAPRDANAYSALSHAAESALYEAIRRGRDQYVL